MAKLINKLETRKFILAKARALRPDWKAERVSVEALDIIEARLRAMIGGMVSDHPTIGKTFYGR